MCESGDGVVCDAVLVEESGGGGLSVGGIAAIAIVIIILICVIGKIIVTAHSQQIEHYPSAPWS